MLVLVDIYYEEKLLAESVPIANKDMRVQRLIDEGAIDKETYDPTKLRFDFS